MTKKIVTRALLVAAVLVTGITASFAQAPVASRVRRVAADKEQAQPVAASTVIMSSAISLNSEQRAKITEMSKQASALQAERAQLWSEYRAITARPNYNDAMAANEAAPRMLRIVEINNQLEPMVARENSQLATILTPAQRAQVTRLVSTAQAKL